MTITTDAPPKHLSHSQVNTWLTCGEQYRLERILKVDRYPNWSTVAGSAVHLATENLDRTDFGIEPAGPTTFAEALDVAIEQEKKYTSVPPEEWRATGRASKEYPNGNDRDWWLSGKGQEMVDGWRAWLRDSPWQIAVGPGGPLIEVEIDAMIGGIPWRGFIDRIMFDVRSPGTLMVLDIKSGARTPKSKRQLGAYALAAKRTIGADVALGAYFMTRKAILEGPYAMDRWVHTDALDVGYSLAWRGIQGGLFIPTASDLCGVCSVNRHCAEYGGDLASGVPQVAYSG